MRITRLKINVLNILSICLLNTIIYYNISLAGEIWAPYYSFELSESVYIPTVGKWGYTTILNNDLGFILKPLSKHTGLFLYGINYIGPGLKRQEGEKFDQRNLSHLLMVQHSFILNDSLKFKTRLNYVIDYWRSGTNELWGKGLYDSNRLGISEEAEIKIGELLLNPQLGFTSIKFPNYTSLIEEFITGSEETASGKQDNNMILFNFKLKYLKNNLSFLTNFQNFLKQQILTEQGTYDEKKQFDYSLELKYSNDYVKITDYLWLNPIISVKQKDSNQGYLHFKSIASTPTFVSNYYDYIKISFSFPININFSKSKILSFLNDYEIINYTDRPRRDENNNFVPSQKQINNLLIFSIIYTTEVNTGRKISLFYTYQSQNSTTKFEKYYPYNYNAHNFGIKFNYYY